MADTAFKVNVVEEEVPAQVVQPREPDADVANVREVHVRVDEQVLDPAAENAVLVEGQGGEGNNANPLEGFVDAEHHEDVFAREASEADEPSDKEE